MPAFDPTAARAAASKRMERALRRGRDPRSAESDWFQDITSIGDLGALDDWCGGRGLRLEFRRHPNGAFEGEHGRIVIAANARPLRQVAYLLHECGHYLVSLTAREDPRFSPGYVLGEGFTVERGFVHKLACVEEEFEAWNRGWRLACRLGLSIRREQFDEVRRDCLRSYLHWGVRRTGA